MFLKIKCFILNYVQALRLGFFFVVPGKNVQLQKKVNVYTFYIKKMLILAYIVCYVKTDIQS